MAGGSSVSLSVVDADNAKVAKKTTRKKTSVKTAVAKKRLADAAKAKKTTSTKTPKLRAAKSKTASAKAAPKATVSSPAKKTAAKKVTAKKASKKTTAKKTTSKKTAAKKAAAKTTKPKKTVRKRAATKKVTPKPATRAHSHTHKTKVAPTPKLDSQKTTGTLKREPLGHLLVETKLREAGFRGGVSSDKKLLEAYSVDESIFAIKPQIVIQPKSQRDVEIAVAVVGGETKTYPSLSLTPRAAGTGLSGGSLTDSAVIDVCAHMRSIKTPKKTTSGVTITVEPGAMWRDVEKILKSHDVYLPSYPASKDLCSIGGSIANNAAGPDSLRFGHCADWVESLDVTLYDGHTYTLKPLSYKEFKTLIKQDHAHAAIAKAVFELIEKNEKTIKEAEPHTKKNSAGYALWDVLGDVSTAQFKRGKGTFDLTKLIAGSQGTIGIITSITLCTEPIQTDTELVVVPVFDLQDAGTIIQKALEFNPINVEIFDGLTFDLALSNPTFFRNRLGTVEFYKVMFAMYSLYHVRYLRKTPEFTLLITLENDSLGEKGVVGVVEKLKASRGKRARHVQKETEQEMFWQIRRASYTLSKFQDQNKRPAAFLEDMTVPPKHLPKFFAEIKGLLKKFNITAAVHGHGGNGHLHFYPLLDFTKKGTPALVEKMAEEFFSVAVKHGGNICGEHNDGIIRTPHLSKMFKKPALDLFKKLEHIFDPDDIFNPGKKVNPRFDIRDSLRKFN